MIESIKIGHFSDLTNGTGCTVILPPSGNIASGYAFGAAPGTREIALLQPDKKVQEINALVLTGGSAFGLGCAQGVMEELARMGSGFKTAYGVVPIVPAAVVFDRNVGNAHAFPTAEDGKQALLSANHDFIKSGNIGAGSGVSVGKWAGLNFAMKSGLGVAQITNGTFEFLAVSVVNAVGDVIDFDGQILAGALNEDNTFLAARNPKIRWQNPQVGMNQNTVLSAVLTNVKLTKTEAYYLANRVHLALARRIIPSHTSFDGDVSFVISVPQTEAPIDLTAAILSEVVEQSVINAVTSCEGLFGLKGFKDLRSK